MTSHIQEHQEATMIWNCILLVSARKTKKWINWIEKIKSFDDLCISPEEKEQMIKEVEQLRKNIIYSSSHLNFFWQHDTMTSHVRDQVYDLWDMIGNDSTFFKYYNNIKK